MIVIVMVVVIVFMLCLVIWQVFQHHYVDSTIPETYVAKPKWFG